MKQLAWRWKIINFIIHSPGVELDYLLRPASVIVDDNNVEAVVHGPQQREQIRQRAVMCNVMWLLRLLTIYRLAHLSASGTHTGECFIGDKVSALLLLNKNGK